MQFKAADDKQPDVDALAALPDRPDVDAPTRRRRGPADPWGCGGAGLTWSH